MNTKKLSEIINTLTKQKGRAYVARQIGINPGTLGTYERGEVETPSTKVLAAIADYMGISLDELLAKISDKPTSVKEKPSAYRLQSFEDVAQLVDNLTLADKKRIITYTLDKLVC